MTAAASEQGPDAVAAEASLNRGERLARDVLHALKIDSLPWKEIQANRREVVRATFREFDAVDEFEGMLAAQMAIAHSIFLGASWLSLDRERPERDRAYYLRMSSRLMALYRQHFVALQQSRRERGHSTFQRKVECPRAAPPRAALPASNGERRGKERGHSASLREAECPRCTREEPPPSSGNELLAPHSTVERTATPVHRATVLERWQIHPPAPEPFIAEPGALKLPMAQSRKRRMMESTGLHLAQGP